MTTHDTTLWDFSLSFYSKPTVQQHCLQLQENDQADVNILLFLLYRATQGHQFESAEIHRIDQAVKHWRDTVIHPIRVVRNRLKRADYGLAPNQQDTMRQTILKTELQGEKLEQSLLSSLALKFAPATPQQAAAHNLWGYADYLGITQHEHINGLLRAFNQSWEIS